MDRPLKARLIGASVLVLLVVLVVPELLSGRKTGTASPARIAAGGQTRTYTIELGGGARAAADDDVPRASVPVESPLAADRPARKTTEPGGAQSGSPPPVAASAAPQRATTAATATAAATRPPPTLTAPQTAAAAAQGTWSVQVGAFGSADSARRLVAQLEADGFEAYVSTARRDGKTLHRVRVGPEPGRTQADTLAGRLEARGLPVSIVAND